MRSKILTFLFGSLLGLAEPTKHPFDYDLHLFSLPGSSERTMIGNEGGHLAPHFSLWEAYAKQLQKY